MAYIGLTKTGKRIAQVDALVVELLARRNIGLARQVITAKFAESLNSGNSVQIFNAEREEQRIEEVRAIAKEHGLNPHFAELILYAIIGESCKQQATILPTLQDAHRKGKKLAITDDEWYAQLKQNLIRLTEHWRDSYDVEYTSAHFATDAYLRFEHELMEQELQRQPPGGVMLDLGTGTGRVAFEFHQRFDRVVGYDLSQHMWAKANENVAARSLTGKVSFECVDLEEGIPAEDASAAYVVMSLGTAGDMRDIKRVIAEAMRVLKQGGQFLFSFYNRDALVYQWDFLPWTSSLAALVDIEQDWLDVQSKDGNSQDEIIPIYAKAYTQDEVYALFTPYPFTLTTSRTYPAVSPILPQGLFTGETRVQETIVDIDRSLAHTNLGAYIIATGTKV